MADAWPARQPATNPQHIDELSGFRVVKDALVSAEAAGAAERTASEAVRALGGVENAVCVPGLELGVAGEGLDYREFRRLGLDVFT